VAIIALNTRMLFASKAYCASRTDYFGLRPCPLQCQIAREGEYLPVAQVSHTGRVHCAGENFVPKPIVTIPPPGGSWHSQIEKHCCLYVRATRFLPIFGK